MPCDGMPTWPARTRSLWTGWWRWGVGGGRVLEFGLTTWCWKKFVLEKEVQPLRQLVLIPADVSK